MLSSDGRVVFLFCFLHRFFFFFSSDEIARMIFFPCVNRIKDEECIDRIDEIMYISQYVTETETETFLPD